MPRWHVNEAAPTVTRSTWKGLLAQKLETINGAFDFIGFNLTYFMNEEHFIILRFKIALAVDEITLRWTFIDEVVFI